MPPVRVVSEQGGLRRKIEKAHANEREKLTIASAPPSHSFESISAADQQVVVIKVRAEQRLKRLR